MTAATDIRIPAGAFTPEDEANAEILVILHRAGADFEEAHGLINLRGASMEMKRTAAELARCGLPLRQATSLAVAAPGLAKAVLMEFASNREASPR